MLLAFLATPSFAQAPGAPAASDTTVLVTVTVRDPADPLEDVTVRSGTIGAFTNAQGIAVLRLPVGDREITATRLGFTPRLIGVHLRAGVDTTVTIVMEQQQLELSGVVVSATRSGRRIDDEPLRVETLGPEEVDEKLLMTPGDITMMLNESSGLRVQTTSASLGGAAVRVQGLRGRYTQILPDGLPLYGGQTGGLGLLQIPPMDLGGVEIIKGVASALYGGSALGGVVNLISRRPTEEPVREALLNATTLVGGDAIGFESRQLNDRWAYSLLVGMHAQTPTDRDGDRWTDVPGYLRRVVRPRVYWSSEHGHSLMLTGGATYELREGGTLDEFDRPGGDHPEELTSNRTDGGFVSGFLLGKTIVSMRGAVARQRHHHLFGTRVEIDRHLTWLGETSVAVPHGASIWVLGAAVQTEQYDADLVDGFDYRFTAPGIFAQNTVTLTSALSVTASVRVDQHSEYGTQVAPRLSSLIRLGSGWTLRASGGSGYFAPTPFIEESEVIGLAPLEPLVGLVEEKARSGSVDVGGTLRATELNFTVFGSVVEHPVGLRALSSDPSRVELVNASRPTRTGGVELMARWNPEPFHVSTSYTFVRSTEQDLETGLRRATPLTPRHQAGIVTMWEREGTARAGLEVYYTGTQSLVDNPYRDASRPYVHVGVLAERRLGAVRVFINAENLLNYRQTRYDPLVLPSPGPGGRRTTDVWGPLDGRVLNAGVRVSAYAPADSAASGSPSRDRRFRR